MFISVKVSNNEVCWLFLSALGVKSLSRDLFNTTISGAEPRSRKLSTTGGGLKEREVKTACFKPFIFHKWIRLFLLENIKYRAGNKQNRSSLNRLKSLSNYKQHCTVKLLPSDSSLLLQGLWWAIRLVWLSSQETWTPSSGHRRPREHSEVSPEQPTRPLFSAREQVTTSSLWRL